MRCSKLLQATLMIVLLCSTGCSSNSGRIENTKWRSIATTVDGNKLPEGWLTLEFGSDNKRLIYTCNLLSYSGTYSLGFGDSVTFNLDVEFNGRKTYVEKISIKDDMLIMTDSDGTTVTLKKSK